MRKKKSRKVGLIGVRKDPNGPPARSQEPREKKHKGKPAGTRNNVESAAKPAGGQPSKTDPRVGSKKPVQLVKKPEPVAKKRFATPADELAALEADNRLAMLLDKLESEQPLSKPEQQYVDERMARHKVLCEMLGIEPDEDEGEDPLDKLDALSLDDYKD